METEIIETKLNLPEVLNRFEEKYNVKLETTSLHGKMLALKVYSLDNKIMVMYARRQGSNYQIFPSKQENYYLRDAFESLCTAVFNSNLWIGGER